MRLSLGATEIGDLLEQFEERATAVRHDLGSLTEQGVYPLRDLDAVIAAAGAAQTAIIRYELGVTRTAEQIAEQCFNNAVAVATEILASHGVHPGDQMDDDTSRNVWLGALSREAWRALIAATSVTSDCSSGVTFRSPNGKREVCGWARKASLYPDIPGEIVTHCEPICKSRPTD